MGSIRSGLNKRAASAYMHVFGEVVEGDSRRTWRRWVGRKVGDGEVRLERGVAEAEPSMDGLAVASRSARKAQL